MSDTEAAATAIKEKETIQKLLKIVDNNLDSMEKFTIKYLKAIILATNNILDENDLMDPNNQIIKRVNSNKETYVYYQLIKNYERFDHKYLLINLNLILQLNIFATAIIL